MPKPKSADVGINMDYLSLTNWKPRLTRAVLGLGAGLIAVSTQIDVQGWTYLTTPSVALGLGVGILIALLTGKAAAK